MRSFGPFLALVGVLVALLSAMTPGDGDLQWSLVGIALSITGAGFMCSGTAETRAPCE